MRKQIHVSEILLGILFHSQFMEYFSSISVSNSNVIFSKIAGYMSNLSDGSQC
jgi:hypothetical protein